MSIFLPESLKLEWTVVVSTLPQTPFLGTNIPFPTDSQGLPRKSSKFLRKSWDSRQFLQYQKSTLRRQHAHRETMGLEGGVSSLGCKGRNYRWGVVKFLGWWNFSEQIWGGILLIGSKISPQMAGARKNFAAGIAIADQCRHLLICFTESRKYPAYEDVRTQWAATASFAGLFILIVWLYLVLQLVRHHGETALFKSFLSFFLGFRRPNLITGLSGWRAPDWPLRTQETVSDRRTGAYLV